MTDIKRIRVMMRKIVNGLASDVLYGAKPESVSSHVEEMMGQFYKTMTEQKLLDWDSLTEDEARELGFMLFDEDEFPHLRLIPIMFTPLLKPGVELTGIDGRKFNFDPENPPDDDTRFGAVAYGIDFSEKNDTSLVPSVCEPDVEPKIPGIVGGMVTAPMPGDLIRMMFGN